MRAVCGILKHRFSTQKPVGLSSADTELYALGKPAAEALGSQCLAADFGIDWRVVRRTDASAAIGISRARCRETQHTSRCKSSGSKIV